MTEETHFVVFHSKNITITSRTMNRRLNVERMLEFPLREQVMKIKFKELVSLVNNVLLSQVYLETDEAMLPGTPYAIRIKFQYKLSEHLEGFYVSTYKDKKGKEK